MVVLAVAASLGAWRWLSAPTVAAISLRESLLIASLQFSARVATASRVDVGSTLTGRVSKVLVSEGATVRAGEGLIALDDDELKAAMAQARAGEQQASARLAGVRGTGRRSSVANVAQAESVLVAAQAELERAQALVAQGFVSAARLDEARRAVAVARAQLEVARAQNSAVAERGSDLVQAQAQLSLAQAATAVAQARFEQALITAPADGRVLSRLVEPGQIVQPGRALMSLALAGPQQLKAQVDERYLQQLRVDQPATVIADAFPEQPFAARVSSMAPLVDAQRGAVEVKLALLAPVPSFLREDMTLSVEVETARRERALALPLAALRSPVNGGRSTVLIADGDGRVQLRDVRLGLRTLASAEVIEGLVAGDLVLLGEVPAPGRRVRADTSLKPAAALSGGDGGSGGGVGAALSNTMGR